MKYTEISLSGKGKEKRVYYEWIRLTACFFVPAVRARAGQRLRIYGEAFPLRGI